jgi:2,7-dihydroxy-5-methyl-1-naphthoate 7-O-methyltransferase
VTRIVGDGNGDHPVSIEALSDLRTPWCVRVAVTLRIAEHVADGVTEVDDLAAAASCDPDMLYPVLSHLVAKGVFAEPSPGRFALNESARALLDPGMRLFLGLDGIGGRLAYAWSTLLTVVRTGEPAYHELFGRAFWADLDAHPDIAASFDDLMGPSGHGIPDTDILVTGDWKSVHTVVDVGGGTGTLLAEILRAHPHVHGSLVDLPRAVASSHEIFQAAGVSDRVTTHGQSFFDPLPGGADLYLLMSVLNDWPDGEATEILRRCAEAAGPHGRVLIVGGVSAGEGRSAALLPETVLMGGKDRRLTQFGELARAAGLDVQATRHLPAGHFAVECRPRQHPASGGRADADTSPTGVDPQLAGGRGQ